MKENILVFELMLEVLTVKVLASIITFFPPLLWPYRTVKAFKKCGDEVQ